MTIDHAWLLACLQTVAQVWVSGSHQYDGESGNTRLVGSLNSCRTRSLLANFEKKEITAENAKF